MTTPPLGAGLLVVVVLIASIAFVVRKQPRRWRARPEATQQPVPEQPAGKVREAQKEKNAAYVPLESNEQRQQREEEAEQERQRLAAERKAKQEARADEVRRRGRPLIVEKIELENAP